MSIPYGLLIEGLVVLLLLVTVFYCISLEGKLRALRSGKDELKGIIESLNKATENAQSGIYHLKAAGAQTATDLSALVSEGRKLSDELELMIGSGKVLADRLEEVRKKPSYASEPGRISGPEFDPGVPEDDKLLRALKEAR